MTEGSKQCQTKINTVTKKGRMNDKDQHLKESYTIQELRLVLKLSTESIAPQNALVCSNTCKTDREIDV